jgi:hypothetical protein
MVQFSGSCLQKNLGVFMRILKKLVLGVGALSSASLCVLTTIAHASDTSNGMLIAKEEEIGDDGYNKTYNDPKTSFKDRMKESRETPVITVANTHGGFTLGLVGDFGPVYDAEPSSSSGMGFGLGVTPGYVIQSETWSRLELGAEIGYHSFNWKNGTTSTASMSPLSVVPQVGFGHSLGDSLFGIVRLGFGFATGSVASKVAATTLTAASTSKTDSKMGFIFSAAYDVTYPTSSPQFFGGLGVTHYKYSFSESTTNSVTTSIDAPVNINHVNVHAGMRMKF